MEPILNRALALHGVVGALVSNKAGYTIACKGDLSEVDVSELEDVVADAEEESTGSFAWSKYPGADQIHFHKANSHHLFLLKRTTVSAKPVPPKLVSRFRLNSLMHAPWSDGENTLNPSSSIETVKAIVRPRSWYWFRPPSHCLFAYFLLCPKPINKKSNLFYLAPIKRPSLCFLGLDALDTGY